MVNTKSQVQGVARRCFTVEEYHKMGEAGLFDEKERVELINGEIYDMSPINSRHAGITDFLASLFKESLSEKKIIRVQNPVSLDESSEPEPDVAVVQFRKDWYTKSHPSPNEIILLVEVSDSTLSFDRAIKLPLYAKAAVPEVWIINLQEDQIEVHNLPSDKGYAQIRVFRPGDNIPHELLGMLEVDKILLKE
jgi:Uma2 family endonuclease